MQFSFGVARSKGSFYDQIGFPSFYTAWVKSGSRRGIGPCPLLRQKQTQAWGIGIRTIDSLITAPAGGAPNKKAIEKLYEGGRCR
jgi:hypothetical protein